MSGWLTNIVPGRASSARWRMAGGRKPYSGRAASAGSSRPTTRIAELVTIRRSTSLAVCWAPIRITPSERPRSAMSSSTSLIGEVPSRGAYLFSSSRTTKSSGRPVPAFSFSSNSVLSVTPTTKRCARSGRLCRSTTVTWADSAVLIWCGRRWARSPRISRDRSRLLPIKRRAKALTVPMLIALPAQVDRVSSSVSCSTMWSTRSP